MVINVDAALEYEGKKTSEIAEALIGKRTFTGWPFLREGLVVGVTDELFRYSEVIMNGHKKVVATPHSPMDVGNWKRKAERIEHHYSKRFGVVLGSVDVLIQVRPLKGEFSIFFFLSLRFQTLISHFACFLFSFLQVSSDSTPELS